ncbi:butyrophilin subfamily 1 member A1-like isoform X2 [Echeneis naucrates]|uniref:butyrophilin subfamily 1 member A1-like isoform X2 n=1 Tax=Echeneis naucrates TaxID=173247 RepID=UPI0011133E08|nr:butyrophilin subfamily 1 member A1-like isoform X2 [Echeneis naucrates]
MKIIIGVLMVFAASGENESTFYGTLNGSVLLQCNCSTHKASLKWQKEEPNKVVYKQSKFSDTYKGRAEITSDCSLLLTNIRPEDQGKYKCIFHNPLYVFHYINLSISASYNVCQTSENNGSKKIFKCNVTGGYREAEIEWTLDKKILANSTETKITHSEPTASNGFYNFRGELEINKPNLTPEPQCGVKAKGIQSNISFVCEQPEISKPIKAEDQRKITSFYKIIPIVLVLGISLVLWHRWKMSQSRRMAEEDAFNFEGKI